jgi:Asp-tRNA(Asn)/Glu-tRNA(Gln) amidotransferase A subunit family amidase
VTVDADGARAEARARDAARDAGDAAGALHGVPIGVKDIIDVAGMPTTSGAAPFAHTHPERDAILVSRLREAGAVILGKTVATQFAYLDPAPTRNPWSAEHTPGGSSSGSAAAVAARHVPAAIGTQTIGSILRPSAFCGVVGLKGTHGSVPLDGVVPLSWSLDHGGVIARSVADAALIEGVLLDAQLEPDPPAVPRLAVARGLMARADAPLREHLGMVLAGLAAAGAEVEEVDLPPSFGGVEAAGRLVLEVEAAAAHRAWFADHAGEYGPRIAGLIRAGQARTAVELVFAERDRAAFRTDVLPLLAAWDALLTPVASGPAPLRTVGTGDPGFCAPWSFAGVPSIAIPTGLDDAGLPLAIQLSGSPDAFARLVGAAAWVEGVVGFASAPPGLPG